MVKTSEVTFLVLFVILLVVIAKLANKVQELDRSLRTISAKVDSAAKAAIPARVGGFACGSTTA